MLIARRVLSVLGLAALAAAIALMLWPIHADGVSGDALQPHYRSFAVEANQPLPAHPTRADFVRVGLTWPHDVVNNRRVLSASIAGGGAVLLLATVWLRKRRD